MNTTFSRAALTIVLFAFASAPTAAPAAAGTEQSSPPIHADHLYHSIERPLLVTIDRPEFDVFLSLALLDAEGESLAPEQPVRPGRADLARLFPALRTLQRAAWVQTLYDGVATGPALVVQPMLSRLVPRTEESLRPDGSPYTRIVGWAHEHDEPQRILSGWRVYLEHDVVLHTSQGPIRLAMRPDHAPNTVWNFLELCRGGFYREVIFHRIVPLTAAGDPFVIQAGDPSRTGSGGPGWWLPIEPSELPHDFGVISMARTDAPDSAGSQFFIGLSRDGTARLDGQYCSFGYAVDGAATILDIAASELADPARGRAHHPPVIRAAELIPAPPRIPGSGRPDARVTPQSVATGAHPEAISSERQGHSGGNSGGDSGAGGETDAGGTTPSRPRGSSSSSSSPKRIPR